MQPLIFLSTRSFINGIKRAFTSGKRLVTLIFVVGYYGLLVFRPLSGPDRMRAFSNPRMDALSMSSIDAVVFAGFAFLSLLLMLPILTPRGGFRQADVDVLFATPVNPRIVLFFRMIRDYLWTLLTPLVFVIFGGRAGVGAATQFVVNMHSSSAVAVRMAAVTWFLMSLSWVFLGYGAGFLINRSDLSADRNKKVIDFAIFGLVVTTCVILVSRLVRDPSAETAIQCAQSPILRVLYFSGTAACWMIVGTLNGHWLFVLLGMLIYVAMITLSTRLALSQLPFMYDQAAVKGFGASEKRALQRNNDMYGLTAQKAREGQFQPGRISRWFGKLNFTGASVLIWKEIILQMRSGPILHILMGSLQLILVVLPTLSIERTSSERSIASVSVLLFVMQGFSVLMLTMNNAVSGFIELLKRVDFQKPLPFRPAGTVFWEVSSKCVPNILVGALASLLVVILCPILWAAAIGSEIFVIGLSLVVSATVFLVTIAFSDAGDASQRGFRGILILIGIVVCSLPSLGLLALLLGFLNLNPLLAAIPATLVNIGVALLVSFVAGGLYDAYNPNE